jgi:hypothetical protein
LDGVEWFAPRSFIRWGNAQGLWLIGIELKKAAVQADHAETLLNCSPLNMNASDSLHGTLVE